MYSPTVLENRSPKPKCWQGWFLLRLWGASIPCLSPSFRGSPAVPDVPGLAVASLQPLPPSSHGVLSVCLYKDISHWIRTHTNSIWLHLNLIISGKNTFPNKVIYSKGTWVKTSTCLFVVFFFFLRKTMFYWIVSLWFFLNFYLFIWLCHVLVAAGRIILESSGIFWWSTRIPQVWCTGSAVAAHGWA